MLAHTRDIVLVKGTGTSIKDYLYISSAPPIVFALSVLSDAVKQRESGWNMFAWSRVSWANNTQPVTIILDTFGQETSAEVRGDGFWIEGLVHVQKNNWVPASQLGEYGWIGGTSTEFWSHLKMNWWFLRSTYALFWFELGHQANRIWRDRFQASVEVC